MIFSDYPKEQIILGVHDALDYMFHDCPVRAYPYFYVRLRAALEYLNINADSIKDLNMENQEFHICQIRDLMYELFDKYGDILESVCENDELTMQYWKADIFKLHSVQTVRWTADPGNISCSSIRIS